MGAKLNFNAHLLKIMFDFLSYLSAGPNLFYCTETLVLYILIPLYGWKCLLCHTFTESWGSKLMPNSEKRHILQCRTICPSCFIHLLYYYYIILLFYTYKSFLGSCLRDCKVKIAEKYFLEAATGLLRLCTP